MLKNKIIFLDLDGTLIDQSLYPPQSAKEAIDLAKMNGHRLYLNTGRSICQVYNYIWELGFDGFVGGNGIYIESAGKPLFHQPFQQELSEKVTSYLVERGIGFFEEGQDSLYAHPNYLPELANLLEVSTQEAQAKTNRLFPKTTYNSLGPHDEVNKISVVLTDKVNLAELSEFIKPELTMGFWALLGKEREFADIFQSGTSKGTAVEFVMKHHNLPMSDAFSFGDSSNDIEMVQMSGTGIAMGNAIPALKAVADFVTDPVGKDGLYNAFRKIGLI